MPQLGSASGKEAARSYQRDSGPRQIRRRCSQHRSGGCMKEGRIGTVREERRGELFIESDATYVDLRD